MITALKRLVGIKPPAPPPPADTPPPKPTLSPEVISAVRNALSIPSDIILIQITRTPSKTDSPKAFMFSLWPTVKFDGLMKHNPKLATLAMRLNTTERTRMYRVWISREWGYLVGGQTPFYKEETGRPTEMYLHLEDPNYELTNRYTGVMTSLGQELVEQVCLSTMSSVEQFYIHKGEVIIVLTPPAITHVFDQFAEVAMDTPSKK